MPRYSAALIALALAGCTSTPERVVVPEIVHVPVREYVPVPERLTAPCPISRAESRTVEALVSAYNANITNLEGCNAKMREIRKLGVE